MSTDTDVIAVDEVERWHDHTDVLVVGFGAAGASAAIEDRDAGAAVQIIERASGPGGTSALTGGHFYLGGGTPVQLACGFPDTADDLFLYLEAVTPRQTSRGTGRRLRPHVLRRQARHPTRT